MRVYVELHFPQFFLENQLFLFCAYFESNILNQDLKICVIIVRKDASSYKFFYHVIKTDLISNKLLIKVLWCKKPAFREILSFPKKLIYKGKCGTVTKQV